MIAYEFIGTRAVVSRENFHGTPWTLQSSNHYILYILTLPKMKQKLNILSEYQKNHVLSFHHSITFWVFQEDLMLSEHLMIQAANLTPMRNTELGCQLL